MQNHLLKIARIWGNGVLGSNTQNLGIFVTRARGAQSLSHVRLSVTLRTVARQAPLSMGFSRQEYRSRLPCPPPGDLPDPGIEPASLMSPALADRFFTTRTIWEAQSTNPSQPLRPNSILVKIPLCGETRVKFLIHETLWCARNVTVKKRKATADWWASRGVEWGDWPCRRGQRWVASGWRVGPSLPISSDKDPGGPCDVDSFTTEHVTKQDQEGPRGVRGRRLQRSAPLCSALLSWVRVQRGDLEPPCAGDVCPGPLQLLRYVPTSSVPAPWENLHFIKHVPPANPLCFTGSLQVSRRRLLV